ncbi:phage terminase small subunit P27 family [Dysgonomonas mossii]|uniref:Phage terminase small subunit P27 family n=1 Tax=Dysgonomonas mossii TaxID=163665 RepID=A0A4Y9IQA5_9BACT|nr:phage terminase small subunit P27 family [Dysgonomonas mossii]MBF0759555.1 phage terminase small subunit P27 family [Dysgonomonas mossii]TFU90521.1 phage terminase small subunit P27 family [Dysgonomonas mossii]
MAVKFRIPKNVSPETSKFIRDVLKELNNKGTIQDIDLGALNMLTVSYEMYFQAGAKLLKDGPLTKNKYGDIIPHPAQTIATKNYAQVMKIMTEYGLTIKSRTSMKTVSTEGQEKSSLDKFFDGKK